MDWRNLAAGALMFLSVPQPSPILDQPAPSHRQSSSVEIDKVRIDRTLAGMIRDGRAAGVSALIWKNGHEAYFGTAGYADREARKPMRRDTLVQLFSMTKPVTGVALMQLWEQGKFGLDEPLAKYLPEFGNVKVFKGIDSNGKPVLEPPSRPILIRDIMRHTAGFVFGIKANPAMGIKDSYPEQAYASVDPGNLDNDLSEFGRRLATVPLLYDPGTRWRYSVAPDIQALLVEKFSGMPFQAYVRQHVFTPLGMKDTGWTQPQERFPRLAIGYAKTPDGRLQRQTDEVMRRNNFAPHKLNRGSSGLVSSLDDYMRFARMLLNHGELDGVRILKPSTVKLMATDQLDSKITYRRITDGYRLAEKGSGGFGFDFFVRTKQPQSKEENRGAAGEFFWDGAWSTLFWVDPANDLAAVFFAQVSPTDTSLHRDFRSAVYGDHYLGPKGD